MRNIAVRLAAGVVIIASAGCSSTPPPATGTGTVPLASSSTGFVNDPVSGVIGAWFAYGDGVGSNAGVGDAGTDVGDSDCVKKGGFTADQCSQITTPTPGTPFAPTDIKTSKQCTSGTAAVVLNKNGSPDYTDLFGAGIGLDFNNPGGDAGPAGYLDLSGYAGIEFDFSADTLPSNSMRVNFPFKTMHGNDSPFWMGATSGESPLTGTTSSPQHVKIAWGDVGGPFYLTQQTPPVDLTPYAFDPKNIQAMEVQVFTSAKNPTIYSFCIANLALTKK